MQPRDVLARCLYAAPGRARYYAVEVGGAVWEFYKLPNIGIVRRRLVVFPADCAFARQPPRDILDALANAGTRWRPWSLAHGE